MRHLVQGPLQLPTQGIWTVISKQFPSIMAIFPTWVQVAGQAEGLNSVSLPALLFRPGTDKRPFR